MLIIEDRDRDLPLSLHHQYEYLYNNPDSSQGIICEIASTPPLSSSASSSGSSAFVLPATLPITTNNLALALSGSAMGKSPSNPNAPSYYPEDDAASSSDCSSSSESDSSLPLPAPANITVATALEYARGTEYGEKDPTVQKALDKEVRRIWAAIAAQPESYILTTEEFAVFNFFESHFKEELVVALGKRYWEHRSRTATTRRLRTPPASATCPLALPAPANIDIATALEYARYQQGGGDPTVRTVLEREVDRIWDNIQAQPTSYLLTREEFAVFNYFRSHFTGETLARAARRRYRDLHPRYLKLHPRI